MSDSASSSYGYKWKEISDLPDDIESLRDRELESLCQAWATQKETIGDDARARDFNDRLAREWAIETGIVEGVYTLDRGITRTLIERGIDSAYIPHSATDRDPELVARIIQAHAEVLDGLFAFITGERVLSTGYIKELHSALLRHQDTSVVFDEFGHSFDKQIEKGSYKVVPNNPQRADGTIHQYCPPEHVAAEMDRLIQFHQHHTHPTLQSHVEAAWLHHAFTQIHPFQDGNGRVARAIATLIFIKDGLFPLVINRDDREKYIDALEKADQGDLSHLIRLFATVQKRALTRAISSAVDVKTYTSVEEALAATRDMLVDLGRIIPAQYLAAKQYAHLLVNYAAPRLASVVATLSQDIARVNPQYGFASVRLDAPPANELRCIGERLQYDPNANEHHQSLVVKFSAMGVASRIVVSFHGVGAGFRGLVASVAYFQVGDSTPVSLCDDIFRISYQDVPVDLQERFAKWLDGCLIKGLAEWRRSLV